MRRLQELERAPDGRSMLSRFLVRGHGRRPQTGWTDQKLRWIEPYWVSQVMIDRIIGLPAVTLRPTAGSLEDSEMTEITRLLALWLGIG